MKRLAILTARAAAALVCAGIRFARWVCFTRPRFPWSHGPEKTAIGATRRQLAAAWGAPEQSTSDAYPAADEAWNFTCGSWQFAVFIKDHVAVRIFAFHKYAMTGNEFRQALVAMGGTSFEHIAPGIWKDSTGATAIQISRSALRFDSGSPRPV